MPHIRLDHRLRLFILAVLVALLTACTAPVRDGPIGSLQLQQRATALAAAGRPAAAAELYWNQSTLAQGLDRTRYRVQAAHWWLEAGQADAAAEVTAGLDGTDLPLQEQLPTALVLARVALAQHRPDSALAVLRQAPIPALVSPAVTDFHRLRAEAYTMAGNRLESARERVWLDARITEPPLRHANHRAIWNALSGLSNTALERLRLTPPPDVLSGWMELVQVGRELRSHAAGAEASLALWRQRYPGHPGEEFLLPQWLGQVTAAGQAIEQIALLLPISGSLAGPAAALRDGVLAARFLQPNPAQAPRIHIYDVGAGPHSVWVQYQQAVNDGAQMVIGPLHKESVQTLAQAGTLAVPVLALNQAEDDSNPALYQFALAPEDEARQVAERARWEGHDGALALIPEGPWGERVYQAFAARWAELGGELLEVQHYAQDQVDFGTTLKDLLNLDQSQQRKRDLVRQLGQGVEFEPRRRQDADFVFLLARPAQARQIRPQLRFHRASDLPVYATSHAYSGHPDAKRDADLDGIRFCDMPWILSPEEQQAHLHAALKEIWPDAMRRYPRLFALGIDAYQLLPYLGQLGPDGFGYINSLTGNLYLDAQQRVRRELLWAQLRRGRPRLLEAALEQLPVPEAPGMPIIPMNAPQDVAPVPEIKDDQHRIGGAS